MPPTQNDDICPIPALGRVNCSDSVFGFLLFRMLCHNLVCHATFCNIVQRLCVLCSGLSRSATGVYDAWRSQRGRRCDSHFRSPDGHNVPELRPSFASEHISPLFITSTTAMISCGAAHSRVPVGTRALRRCGWHSKCLGSTRQNTVFHAGRS